MSAMREEYLQVGRKQDELDGTTQRRSHTHLNLEVIRMDQVVPGH